MGELKILGKIDLSGFEARKERPNLEKVSGILKSKMESLCIETSKNFPGFMDEDGSIKMEGDESASHGELIRAKEEGWAKLEYLNIEDWNKRKEKKDSNLAEIAITLILHEKLKDRFLVARASKYDDYENGIDHVLLDKETGSVVCGFDQVLGMGKHDGSDKKKDKVQNIIKKGGARLEYGCTINENGELIRKKLTNIPSFFLGISKDDLDKLLLKVQKNENITDFSDKIMKDMINSLDGQFEEVKMIAENNNSDHEKLLENIENFRKSLDIIKEIAS
ncbi:MAG: hypothetical protein WC280_00120 [Patescibacteria group bacterium]